MAETDSVRMGPTSAENLCLGKHKANLSAADFSFFTFSIVSCSLDFLGKSQTKKSAPLYPSSPYAEKRGVH